MPANSARVFFKLLIVLVVLAAAAVAAVYYSQPVAKVDRVTRGDAANIIPGSVVVEAERISPITSEVEGKILETKLAPGSNVKEGDVLVQLDTTDIDLDIARAKAEFDAAATTTKIALETARLQWTTREEDVAAAERAHTQGKIADADFKKAQREFEVAKQERARAEAESNLRVATLENNLKVAQRKKEKMTIRAPFNGTIIDVLARQNDLIGSKQPIANIIALTRRVRAKISEENFSQVQTGQKAKVTFLGYRDKVFAATVAEKLPAPEQDTQRYIAYLKVDIPPEQLLPSLTGEVGIVVGEHTGVLRIPRVATWDGYVYVIENGRAQERKIQTGYLDYNFVEVTGGLKEGEVIIVQDRENFHNGQRVRIQPAS